MFLVLHDSSVFPLAFRARKMSLLVANNNYSGIEAIQKVGPLWC